MLYAHAIIELGDRKIPRGAQVQPDEFTEDTLVAFKDSGTLSEQPYDPAKDRLPPPAQVEIEGVVYKQANDGAEAADAR